MFVRSFLNTAANCQEISIESIDYGNVVAVQDENEERHILLRSIEKTSYTDFIDSIRVAFEEMESEKEIWELEINDMIARRVKKDEEE